ncbi:MAG: hypothetical protein M3Z70_02150 [Bartonella sp.]|nr:hypothetical protein [Bartonella sp.]
MTKKIKILIICVLCIICLQIFACGAAYLSGVRVFVIQPIGAVPEGATVVISGVKKLNAIDSPDAVCDRYGTVNLICRAAVLANVADNGKILLRLPYSPFLYHLSGAPETTR